MAEIQSRSELFKNIELEWQKKYKQFKESHQTLKKFKKANSIEWYLRLDRYKQLNYTFGMGNPEVIEYILEELSKYPETKQEVEEFNLRFFSNETYCYSALGKASIGNSVTLDCVKYVCMKLETSKYGNFSVNEILEEHLLTYPVFISEYANEIIEWIIEKYNLQTQIELIKKLDDKYIVQTIFKWPLKKFNKLVEIINDKFSVDIILIIIDMIHNNKIKDILTKLISINLDILKYMETKGLNLTLLFKNKTLSNYLELVKMEYIIEPDTIKYIWGKIPLKEENNLGKLIESSMGVLYNYLFGFNFNIIFIGKNSTILNIIDFLIDQLTPKFNVPEIVNYYEKILDILLPIHGQNDSKLLIKATLNFIINNEYIKMPINELITSHKQLFNTIKELTHICKSEYVAWLILDQDIKLDLVQHKKILKNTQENYILADYVKLPHDREVQLFNKLYDLNSASEIFVDSLIYTQCKRGGLHIIKNIEEIYGVEMLKKHFTNNNFISKCEEFEQNILQYLAEELDYSEEIGGQYLQPIIEYALIRCDISTLEWAFNKYKERLTQVVKDDSSDYNGKQYFIKIFDEHIKNKHICELNMREKVFKWILSKEEINIKNNLSELSKKELIDRSLRVNKNDYKEYSKIILQDIYNMDINQIYEYIKNNYDPRNTYFNIVFKLYDINLLNYEQQKVLVKLAQNGDDVSTEVNRIFLRKNIKNYSEILNEL